MIHVELQKEMAQKFLYVVLLSKTQFVKTYVMLTVSQATTMLISAFVLYHAPLVLMYFERHWKSYLSSVFLLLEAGDLLKSSFH